MLTAAERAILRRKLERYEGRVPHMYLDTDGNVTVGVGHLLPTVEAAQRLGFVTTSGTRATPQQIAEDFRSVSKQETGLYAARYSPFTKLTLPNSEIDRITRKHIDSFHDELKTLYRGFCGFPSPARLALFDMIFNLGATNLRGLYPKMSRAVAERNWEEAAAESSRKHPVSPMRNAYVRQLFHKAAEAVERVP